MSENNVCDNYETEVDKLYSEIERLNSPENLKKANRKKTVSAMLNVFYAVVIILLLSVLVVIQVAKEKGEAPAVFGCQLFYIQTGSMDPTYPVGSVIFAKSVKDTASLSAGEYGVKDGDVVVFNDLSGRKITHRIESVITLENGEIAYRTRGDSVKNTTDSEILTQDRIIAVVVMRVV